MDGRRLIIANGVTVDLSEYLLKSEAETLYATLDGLNNKQDKLISGTNIKTVNGTSILGSGDITISGGNSNANVQAVDTGDVIDDVIVDYATTAYVDGLVGDINSVLDNIIDGEGSGGSSGGPTVEYVDYQGFITVEDNKVYVFTIPITELSINVETELPIGSVLRFRTEFEGCTLSVPDSVCWANGVLPNIESFKSYELSLTTTADRFILAVITTF